MDKKEEKVERVNRWAWLPAAMPKVAAAMAAKRVELGSSHVAECFKRGMAGEPGYFFAREGPLAIGTPWDDDPVLQAFAAQAIKSGQALVVIRKVDDGTH